jgi:hypothetical protein
VGLLGHRAVLLEFSEQIPFCILSHHLSPHWARTRVTVSPLLCQHLLPSLFFHSSHHNGPKEYHYGFGLHFSDDWWGCAVPALVSHMHIIFGGDTRLWRNVYSSPLAIFKLCFVVELEELFILYTNSLSDGRFANVL